MTRTMATKKSRNVMKENRIPLGKKKEHLNTTTELNINTKELKTVNVQVLPAKKAPKTTRKAKKTNESVPLKVININSAPTDTSLNTPEIKPRSKLSTINEIEEKNTLIKLKTEKVTKDVSKLSLDKTNDILVESTILIRNQPEEPNTLGDVNITINDMKPPIPEVVLSPYVCTTRGQKWKPSPRKPPKLSELFNKYEDDNVADNYRKKLDNKTIELQNKVKYWTELSSENDCNIPQTFKDEIDVVCGQTRLLTTDKFMQMRSLIEEYDNKSGSMPIKTDDLDGFWDMLLLQVEKLEGQFNQLIIMKENNWAPLQPIAKKVLSKISKINKPAPIKSKFADFLKNKKLNEKKLTPKSENANEKNNSNYSRFHEMKSSNNTCLISSTPTSSSSNQKITSFTPMLLKTMELSYVARRSGMTPVIEVDSHVSPLKPALKTAKQEKSAKPKNIQFKTSETNSNEFVTPENSCNDDETIKKNIQDRVATPHTAKTSNVNKKNVEVESQNNLSAITSCPGDKKVLKKIKIQIKKTKETEIEVTQYNLGVRRSSRLANKPLKNYKC